MADINKINKFRVDNQAYDLEDESAQNKLDMLNRSGYLYDNLFNGSTYSYHDPNVQYYAIYETTGAIQVWGEPHSGDAANNYYDVVVGKLYIPLKGKFKLSGCPKVNAAGATQNNADVMLVVSTQRLDYSGSYFAYYDLGDGVEFESNSTTIPIYITIRIKGTVNAIALLGDINKFNVKLVALDDTYTTKYNMMDALIPYNCEINSTTKTDGVYLQLENKKEACLIMSTNALLYCTMEPNDKFKMAELWKSEGTTVTWEETSQYEYNIVVSNNNKVDDTYTLLRTNNKIWMS